MKKTFVNIFVAVVALLSSVSFASCKDAIVSADKLPEQAQSFLKEYFAETAVSYVKKDREVLKTTYEVVLQDGTEIDFDAKGQWKSVDCKKSAVPAALIPAGIAAYVQSGFPGQDVVQIEKKPFGFEVELLSGLELKFDKQGVLVHVDD